MDTEAAPASNDLITLTADIVSAHVSNNNVTVSELPALIASIHDALANVGSTPVQEEVRQEPAVSIRASIKPDYIVCLEDGKKLKMMKRYLRTKYNMAPDEYRAKWGLPRDYPMVAPNYREARSKLAHSIGLGKKATAAKAAKSPAKTAPVKVAKTPAKTAPVKVAKTPAETAPVKVAKAPAETAPVKVKAATKSAPAKAAMAPAKQRAKLSVAVG